MRNILKRVISIIVLVVMIEAILLPNAFATQSKIENFNKTYTLTGNPIEDIVAVATAQIGKTKSNLGYTEAWCADFVCDCAKLAGINESAIPFNYYSRGGVRYLYSYMMNNCGAKTVSTPQKGDLVFYYCTTDKVYCHIGIMIDSVYSIQGNVSSSVMKLKYDSYRDTYYDNNTKTGGTCYNVEFVRPNYNTIQSKLNEILSVYPDGSYFTVASPTSGCTSSNHDIINGVWCQGCYLPNIPARGNLPSGASVGLSADTCAGFANYVYYIIYGHQKNNNEKTNNSPVFGDLVYTGKHWFIYLSEDSNNYYVYDANGYNGSKNMVKYNNYYPKSAVTSLTVYHASNYDEVKGTISEMSYQKIKADAYYLKNKSTGKYLTVDEKNNESNISVSAYNGSEMQKFVIGGAIGNTYKLSPIYNSSLGVSPLWFTNTLPYGAGNNVVLYTTSGETNNDQHWGFEAVSGGYILHNMKDDTYVIGLDGDNAQLETKTGADDQIWILEPAYSEISSDTYFLKNKSSGTYMTVDGKSSDANISAQTYNGGEMQTFVLNGSDKQYTLSPIYDQNLNVNPYYVDRNNLPSGASVTVYKASGEWDNDQHWGFEAVSGGYIIHNMKDQSLVMGLDGNNVQVETRTGANDQIWILEFVNHTHNYTEYVYTSDTHPHYKCYKCSCGDIKENTNEPVFSSSCEQCLDTVRPEIPVLSGMKSAYLENETVIFSWNEIKENLTHYSLCVEVYNGSKYENYQFFREMTDTSCSGSFPKGSYRALILSYNSNYWESDRSDWIHSKYTQDNYVYFTVNSADEYTVRFVDYNGTVISERSYHYGDTVTVPANPTRAADSTYTYTFKGWDKSVTTVSGNATYTAVYTAEPTVIDENSPRIIIEKVSAEPGGEATVKITLKNNPGLASMKLTLTYGDELTLTKIKYGASLGGTSQQPQKLSSPVILNWYNGSLNTNGDIEYAELTFKLSENAELDKVVPINVTYNPNDVFNINEQNIVFAVVNGSVTVSSHKPGDINEDGAVDNKDVVQLFKYLSGWDVKINNAAADVNGDGERDNKDVVLLFKYLSGWDVVIK